MMEKVQRYIDAFRNWKCWQGPKFIGFRVVAVLLAVFMWGYVTVAQNPLTEAVFTVPIETRNLADTLAQPELNYQVQVRAQGTSSVIDSLTSRDFVAYIDLEGYATGLAEPQVFVVPPDNVTLVSCSPESVELTLEPLVSQRFDVSLDIAGEPAESYQRLDAVLSPELATVSGAQEYIDKIDRVRVAADITNMEGNYNHNLAIEVLDADGADISGYFTITPASLNALIPIVYDQPESSLAVRPQISGAAALGYEISRIVVEPATVQAFSDLSTLNSLYYLETEQISVEGITETSTYTLPLLHVDNVTLSTDTVTVIVQVEPIASAAYSRELLYVRDLPSGLAYTVPPVSIDITVYGADSAIANLTESDIIAYLDCSSINDAGEYNLPISIDLPSGVSLREVSPGSVTITVRRSDDDMTDTTTGKNEATE